jgi:glycerol-3-phosphate dehydrogenase
MVCVAGGKWTTYRLMAEQTVTFCRGAGLMAAGTPLTSTRDLALDCPQPEMWERLPGAGRMLAPGVTEAFVRWCVREAQACTVEDVLARRSRLLLVDARGARQVASDVSDIMRDEGVENPDLDCFTALTNEYLPEPGWLSGMN